MDEITVVAIDDHFISRRGVRSMIEEADGLHFIDEGSCGEDVFRLVEKHTPDVLILDLNMPQYPDKDKQARFQALPTISRLRQQHPATGIILLTVDYQPSMIHGALERGVQGYILKSDDMLINLPAAVRRVNQGGAYFSETIEAELLKKLNQQGKSISLPARQMEALTLLTTSANATHEQRAQMMNISVSTFKKHLDEVYKALGVNSSRAAVIKAMEYGLIPPPEYIPANDE